MSETVFVSTYSHMRLRTRDIRKLLSLVTGGFSDEAKTELPTDTKTSHRRRKDVLTFGFKNVLDWFETEVATNVFEDVVKTFSRRTSPGSKPPENVFKRPQDFFWSKQKTIWRPYVDFVSIYVLN